MAALTSLRALQGAAGAGGGGGAVDLAGMSYASKSVNVSALAGSASSLCFSPDGTKMYVGDFTDDGIHQYTLSTAWDVSTATAASKFLDVSAQVATPVSISFKDDGTQVYVHSSNTDTLYAYNLSTAWDISTGTYASDSLYVSAVSESGQAMAEDYVVGVDANRTVRIYTMSTPWDLSSGTQSSVTTLADQGYPPQAFWMNATGTFLYILHDGATDIILEYELSTPWDATTAVYTGASLDVTATAPTARGLWVSPDGANLYVLDGGSPDTVFQFS